MTESEIPLSWLKDCNSCVTCETTKNLNKASDKWVLFVLKCRTESEISLPRLKALASAVLNRNFYSCVTRETNKLNKESFIWMMVLFVFLQVTGILSWIVRSWTDVENNIVSVERVKEYDNTPKEVCCSTTGPGLYGNCNLWLVVQHLWGRHLVGQKLVTTCLLKLIE